mgnify:CR=1 FL=1
MILKNADIFDSEFALRRADVRVEDGKIAEIGENLNGGEEHDLSGCVILPGFIDIHIHGCGGADFSDALPDTLETMSRTLARFGVTSFCPASMTLPYDRIERAFERAAEYIGKESGAYIHGINMEGPFLSYAKRGAPQVYFSTIACTGKAEQTRCGAAFGSRTRRCSMLIKQLLRFVVSISCNSARSAV